LAIDQNDFFGKDLIWRFQTKIAKIVKFSARHLYE